MGTIVDGQTGIPLGNAHITLERITCAGNETNRVNICQTNYFASTNSDETGRFELSPLKQWAVLIIPGDYFPMYYEVSIERTNYEPVRIGFAHRATQTGQDAIRDLAVIRLNSK